MAGLFHKVNVAPGSYAGLLSDEVKKWAVWGKGHPVAGKDPNVIRKDDYGNEMHYEDYGKTTLYGWQFDHYPTPVAFGGSDEVSNLRPLNSRANASLGGLLAGLLNNR